MNEFLLPSVVQFVLSRLNQSGYEAYVVGGCVRDHLMGRVPSDYDVTTNAKPQEMQAVFADCRVVETGLKHGTLTVVLEGMNIEVTTYRVDGAYEDGRHPTEVTFTASLEEDLCRRDFTVNAIAYSTKDGFADPFGGMADLQRERIACVGDPVQRFSEDALRILRAVRFCATLGFCIDPATAEAVTSMRASLALISRERIYQEMTKLICGVSAAEVMRRFPEVLAFALDPVDERIGAERVAAAADAVSASPVDAELRYAVLLCSVSADAEIYSSLKPSRKSLRDVVALMEHRTADTADRYTLKTLMGRFGESFPLRLIAFRAAMGDISESQCTEETALYTRLLATNPCVRVADLAVNGADAAAAGLRGVAIGQALADALDAVMREEIPNDRESLLCRLHKIAECKMC